VALQFAIKKRTEYPEKVPPSLLIEILAGILLKIKKGGGYLEVLYTFKLNPLSQKKQLLGPPVYFEASENILPVTFFLQNTTLTSYLLGNRIKETREHNSSASGFRRPERNNEEYYKSFSFFFYVQK